MLLLRCWSYNKADHATRCTMLARWAHQLVDLAGKQPNAEGWGTFSAAGLEISTRSELGTGDGRMVRTITAQINSYGHDVFRAEIDNLLDSSAEMTSEVYLHPGHMLREGPWVTELIRQVAKQTSSAPRPAPRPQPGSQPVGLG